MLHEMLYQMLYEILYKKEIYELYNNYYNDENLRLYKSDNEILRYRYILKTTKLCLILFNHKKLLIIINR